jgi:hypothetical protein
MNSFFRNILAIISGLLIGSAVNMGIVMISGSIIPQPEGADVTTMEGLVATIHLFEPKHFIMPFLAHALGTFSGSLIAASLVKINRLRVAFMVGIGFLVGGIIASIQIPSPLWFLALDLIVAYLPMSYLAALLINYLEKNRKGASR